MKKKQNLYKLQLHYFNFVSFKGDLEPRAIATATFIQQADELFDSFNGSQRNTLDGQTLKCPMKESSPHEEYWKGAYKMVNCWKYQITTKKRVP